MNDELIERDALNDELLCWYDLQTYPANYDLLTFAVISKSEAIRKNKKAHIIFVPKEDKINKKQYSLEEQEFRINHILVPAAYSLGLSYTYCRTRKEAEDIYYSSEFDFFVEEYDVESPPKRLDRNTSLCHILEQYKTAKLFWPQPTQYALDLIKHEFSERPFVITLRECYRESRNSDLEEWGKFMTYVYEKEDIVVIRDTAKWNDDCRASFRGVGMLLPTFPLASIDFDIRLALYHHAKMNFSVGGGATSLLYYSSLPYRSFKIAPEKRGSASPEFLNTMGFPVGSQFPWSNKNQKLIWESDDFKILKREYDLWIKN
jgi:hypothetical protein